MKVLHFIYDDPSNPWVAGGGAVRVREIYRRLAGELDGVEVISGNFPGAGDGLVDGVRYRRIGSPSPYWWSRLSYSVRANQILRRADYDAAVIDFSTYAPIWIPSGRPVGMTVHHITGKSAEDRWGPAASLVMADERRRLRRASAFSATSRATRDQLRRIADAGASIQLVQAGVEDALFDAPRRESDYMLYFGRLDWHQKGLDVLLNAIRRVATERSDVRLLLAGRGTDGAKVIDRSYELGIRDNVHVIGAVDDAERTRLFSGARMMIMPSRFEGFGMAAAEAMAAGVPLIASDAGSLPEVVDEPNGGIIFPSGDSARLAEEIIALLDDRTRRRELSRSARLSAERFRWDRIAADHLTFLRGIAGMGEQGS